MGTCTLMSGTDLEQRAQVYLGTLGVARVLPLLWEMVVDEQRTIGAHWTVRDVARRYLDYLRDHTRRSGMDG